MSNLTETPNLTVNPLGDDMADQVLTLTGNKTPCNCQEGCPQLTGRYFAQGHDARLVTRLRDQVLGGKQELAEAFAEILKRGGTTRLQIKLENAVVNARSPKAKKSGRKVAKVVDTFELGEFTLAAMPIASVAKVVAKVGRWEYRGEILTYQIVEDGRPSEGDTVDVFEYQNAGGQPCQTVSFTRIRVDEEFDSAPAEVVAEPDTSDIPF